MIPFVILHHIAGYSQLTLANYVEHYGLLREKKSDGKYVPCDPIHSWNTNHIVSNLMLFHLQRHSDHHANPMRPYQSLRDFKRASQIAERLSGLICACSYPAALVCCYEPEGYGLDQGRYEQSQYWIIYLSFGGE